MVARTPALRLHTGHHQQPGAGHHPSTGTRRTGGGAEHHHAHRDGTCQHTATGGTPKHLAQRTLRHNARLRRRCRHILGALASEPDARRGSKRPAQGHRHRDGTDSHWLGRDIPLHRTGKEGVRGQILTYRPAHHTGLDSAQATLRHARRGRGKRMGRIRQAV